MDTGIDGRVSALLPKNRTHREMASAVGMTADAFSRAINGQRGFAAIELARLAELLNADLHYLITGNPDPHRLVVAARHTYDPASGRRHVPGADDDSQILSDIALAYRQAEPAGMPASELPQSAAEAGTRLGSGFVRPFVDRLETSGVDVVRLPGLSTQYCFTITGRAVIVVPATGSWFWENWGLAHELGHLALGHVDHNVTQTESDSVELAANAFAAELLLPAHDIRAVDWASITPAELADRVWNLGVSTEALARRLTKLGIRLPPVVSEWSVQPTQRLLRHHWTPSETGDPITRRMDAASERHFPLALQDAHLELIAKGALPKHTLAWMLGVDQDTLEVDEPMLPPEMSSDELTALLGS